MQALRAAEMSCLSTRASIRASSVSGGGSCAFPGQLRAHSHRVRAVGAEGGTGGASNYNDQITAYAQGGQWQAAQTVHEEMRAKGMQPDIVAYDALITAYDNTAQWRLAEAAFEEMQANGLTPDKVTYSSVLTAYDEGGQWQAAETAFEEVRLHGSDGAVER
jgi:pentatricopeptide repeat protein